MQDPTQVEWLNDVMVLVGSGTCYMLNCTSTNSKYRYFMVASADDDVRKLSAGQNKPEREREKHIIY